MISYRVDFSDHNGDVQTEYFDGDRGRAMSRARKASKEFGMAYMIRSKRTALEFHLHRWDDTGALGFAGGRIDTREGVTQ